MQKLTTREKIIIGIIVIFGYAYFTGFEKIPVNYGLTNDDIDIIIKDTEAGFHKAEKEVLGVTPRPTPQPVGPDPDPEKCICKGTGKIVQGDGHVSPCPYHTGDPQELPTYDINENKLIYPPSEIKINPEEVKDIQGGTGGS
tara:strand:+ start:1845 stop:2270 length:426 start_codon:yes stop_codon:yes gene_type:complete